MDPDNRQSLLNRLSVVVDGVIDAGKASPPVGNDVPQMIAFCIVLEEVLRHGLKDKSSFWSGTTDYWNYLENLEKGPARTSILKIKNVSDLRSSKSKGRAWLRLVLVHHKLAEFMEMIVFDEAITMHWYEDFAVLRSARDVPNFLHLLELLTPYEFHLPGAGMNLEESWTPAGARPPPPSLLGEASPTALEPLEPAPRPRAQPAHGLAPAADVLITDRKGSAKKSKTKKKKKKKNGTARGAAPASPASSMDAVLGEGSGDSEDSVADEDDAGVHGTADADEPVLSSEPSGTTDVSIASLMQLKNSAVRERDVALTARDTSMRARDVALDAQKRAEAKAHDMELDIHDKVKEIGELRERGAQQEALCRELQANKADAEARRDQSMKTAGALREEVAVLKSEIANERDNRHAAVRLLQDMRVDRRLRVIVEQLKRASASTAPALFDGMRSDLEDLAEDAARCSALTQDQASREVAEALGRTAAFQTSVVEMLVALGRVLGENDEHREDKGELEGQPDSLRQQVDRLEAECATLQLDAARSESLETERVRLEGEVAQVTKEKTELLTAMENMSNELLKLREQRSDRAAAMEALEGKLTEQERLLSSAHSDAAKLSRVSAVVEEARESRDVLLREVDTLVEEKAALEKTLMNTVRDASAASQKAAEAEERTVALEASHAAITRELADVKGLLEVAQQKVVAAEKEQASSRERDKTSSSLLAALRETEEELTTLNKDLEAQVDEVTRKYDEVYKGKAVAEKDRDLYQQHAAAAQERMTKLFERCTRLEEEHSSTKQQLEAERAKTGALEERVANIKALRDGDATREEKLRNSEKALEAELAAERERVQELTEQISSLVGDVAAHKIMVQEFEAVESAQDAWVQDAQVTDCSLCAVPFGLLVRKHHCRTCGHIFCYECASNRLQLSSHPRPMRVCDNCFDRAISKSSRRRRTVNAASMDVSPHDLPEGSYRSVNN